MCSNFSTTQDNKCKEILLDLQMTQKSRFFRIYKQPNYPKFCRIFQWPENPKFWIQCQYHSHVNTTILNPDHQCLFLPPAWFWISAINNQWMALTDYHWCITMPPYININTQRTWQATPTKHALTIKPTKQGKLVQLSTNSESNKPDTANTWNHKHQE